ncbi:MAG: hypothetical protein ACI89T_000453 [Cognaticolwellia sp.]|jgi:hypothetical protein
MMKELEEINNKLDKILNFLDIQEHRVPSVNNYYEPDTMQKLISDTTHSILRDTYIDQKSYQSSSAYLQNRIALDEAKMFRSEYIPRKYGFVDYDSRYDLFRFALSLTCDSPGILLEFGVFKGGSAEFMARYSNEPIYGFDSFEGLPSGWCAGSTTGRFSLDGKIPNVSATNVEFIKGWFDDTLPSFLDKHSGQKIKFIHFDCDLYISHQIVFNELLKNKIDLEGTIVLFDEYINYPNWEQDGHKALQEFVEKSPWGYRYVGFTTRYPAVAIEFFKK